MCSPGAEGKFKGDDQHIERLRQRIPDPSVFCVNGESFLVNLHKASCPHPIIHVDYSENIKLTPKRNHKLLIFLNLSTHLIAAFSSIATKKVIIS